MGMHLSVLVKRVLATEGLVATRVVALKALPNVNILVRLKVNLLAESLVAAIPVATVRLLGNVTAMAWLLVFGLF